jgi:hypothetical protein
MLINFFKELFRLFTKWFWHNKHSETKYAVESMPYDIQQDKLKMHQRFK